MTPIKATLLCAALAGCAGLPTGGRPIVVSQADDRAVPPGAALPFGEIGTTCGLAPAQMGTAVARASGYTIYDSAAGSTVPRTHYLTGFADGCARQFTAALVLTGDVGTHEVVRYAGAPRPYSRTDTAYETIKAAACVVPSGQPCGARIDALARRTVFVTAYPQFSDSREWTEVLLHEGEVAAIGTES